MRHSKFIALILATVLVLVFAQIAFSETGIQTIGAKNFWQEFEDDREKAEAKYIGQTLNFTGVVTGTGISIYLTPNVMLSDSPNGRTHLVCVLPRADVGKLSEFKKGEQATLMGRVYRSKSGGSVVIKECRRVES
ncbi:OB-fold putative lipoprotein [Synergistaceae bacterium OttesenSCG-928-I11]|nr:OB-fold putative lipoprotein [Synergistaceae bacterium OttesenSCG-928-I11]